MQIKPQIETFARIKVVGVGGGGGNTIDHMVSCRIHGVEFIAVNTDAQDLHHSQAKQKIHVGKNTTRGLGAGMNPELGKLSAEENKEEIKEALKGADMVFITAGMGGGTGTGGAPVVAEAAKEIGALTVAVVTKPFSFEGQKRNKIAEEGLSNLAERVDTMIVIPNDRVLAVIDKKTPMLQAFAAINDILRHGVQGISDLIVYPGIINVDFADVKAIMQDAGTALMGIGRATGEDRAAQAAKMAIDSPLLEANIEGAKGVLFSIAGGSDITMWEINEAAKIITDSADKDAKIIFGAMNDERLRKGELKVTVVATGFAGSGGSFNSKQQSLDLAAGQNGLKNGILKDEKKTENGSANSLYAAKTIPAVKINGNGANSQMEDTEWDTVPAFIRRKIGK